MTETREEEWKTYTIRVKKDHEWPHHGSDIEFNGCRYKRADLAEKPAIDDEEVREASKYLTSLLVYRQQTVNSFPPEMVGAIETLIRAAQNSVKQNPDDHTQPVLQPVGELQEAIEELSGDAYMLDTFTEFLIRDPKKMAAQLRTVIAAAQSQNKNGEPK